MNLRAMSLVDVPSRLGRIREFYHPSAALGRRLAAFSFRGMCQKYLIGSLLESFFSKDRVEVLKTPMWSENI